MKRATAARAVQLAGGVLEPDWRAGGGTTAAAAAAAAAVAAAGDDGDDDGGGDGAADRIHQLCACSSYSAINKKDITDDFFYVYCGAFI